MSGSTITVTMNDSYGDGWNGAELAVTSASDSHTMTFTNGEQAIENIVIINNITYTVTCSGGSYPSEVSWIISHDILGVLLEGGANYTGSLIIVVNPVPLFDHYITLTDSGGSGWNSDTITITSIDDVHTFGLSTGASSTEDFSLVEGNIYTIMYNGNSNPDQITWGI